MSSIAKSVLGSRERRIAVLADELRADAGNALHYPHDEADGRRFRRLRELTARLLSFVDERPVEELTAILAADTGLRTPWAAVALMINDQRHGLLAVRDERTGRYGTPHTLVGEDEDVDTAVARLASDLVPDSQVLPVPHGMCDSISAGLATVHTYYLTYVVDLTFVPPEDIRGDLVPVSRIDEGELDDLTVYIMGGADRTVLDAPLALPTELRHLIAELGDLAGEGAADTTDRYNLERYDRISRTVVELLEGVGSEVPLRPGRIEGLAARGSVTAAEAFVLDGRQRLLLMRRSDTGQWAMPGGASEVGESSAATAVREVAEELGVDIEIDGLAGVYDLRTIRAPNPGTWVQFVYVATLADPGARPHVTAEAGDWRWFRFDEIDGLDLFNGHRTKIDRVIEVLKG